MRFILIGILIFSFGIANAQTESLSRQDVLNKFGFTEHLIDTDKDTISFYIHKKPNSEPKNLVLYLQGSAPDPLFVMEEHEGKYTSYRWFPGDYKLLGTDYSFAVIAKTGIPGIFEENTKRNISKYQELNSLENRVYTADLVIDYIAKNLIPDLNKVIVYGHSEGAPVAAKLGTLNNKITHIGFWAGNALPDFFDFALFNTKALNAGKVTKDKAFSNIDTLINTFKRIAENPSDVSYSEFDDYTNKRWWSYAEPPINNLLKIDIPVFVQVAGNDESAPVESSFLIPLEFTRLNKTNLTYKICIDCNHSFEIINENGETEDKWSEIFQIFMKWTEENVR